MGLFSIRSEREGRLRRITPTGELDLATVSILEREYEFARDDPAATMIVVDLTRLTFDDSTGISALLHMSAACADAERLRRINGSRTVEHLIDPMGVRHRLPVISGGRGSVHPASPGRHLARLAGAIAAALAPFRAGPTG